MNFVANFYVFIYYVLFYITHCSTEDTCILKRGKVTQNICFR